MPSKKSKYNSRFPPARIKKIMQSDEDIGKVAAAVPVIISRTIERFTYSLLHRAAEIAVSKNVRTLTPSHIQQSIMAQPRFSFMLDLCQNIDDSGKDKLAKGSQFASNSVVMKEKNNVTRPYAKKRILKKPLSSPEANLPKRKRGRPRKVKSFVDEDNVENDSESLAVSNSFKEEKDVSNSTKRPTYNTSISNLSLSEVKKEEVSNSFLENININIPGFGSGSLIISNVAKGNNNTKGGVQQLPQPASFNPFISSTNHIKSDDDEDYD